MADNYYETVNEAVRDLSEHGYDSAERVAYWQVRIKQAAERTMGSRARAEQLMREAMASIYRRMVEQGGLLRFHAGVGRFTIDRLKPSLRAELERRIAASADLIKLNRTEAIEKTLRRFAGWATSVPRGGAAPGQKRPAAEDVKKALKQLPFVERRVLIDQGHKLTAALSETLAQDGGAIAGVWHSHWKQAGYDYREDHKDRDGEVYLLRTSWARDKGLVKAGPAGYYDRVTSVGEEPFCRCWVDWIYSLRKVPGEMLTDKGRDVLAEARKRMQTMTAGAR